MGGITAVHDVSGRRAQLETPLRQFTLGKSFDSFTPLGPAVASLDGLDLADLDVRTTVSGEVMQDANTRDLIFSVVDLIEYLSRGLTLEPGDVIATGTPGGGGRFASPQAVPARRRRGRDLCRRRGHAAQPGACRGLGSQAAQSLSCCRGVQL